MKSQIVLAFALSLGAASQVSAECRRLTLGETSDSFIRALKPRLAKFGADLTLGKRDTDQGDIYEISGSNTFVHTASKDDVAYEVGANALARHTEKDIEEVFTVTAFAIARFTSEFESDIKDELYKGLNMRPDPGTWTLRVGQTFTTVSMLDNGGIGTVVHKCVR